MEIELGQIILVTLSSSVVGSVITLIGNRILQQRNYKSDYYRKLLDKRIAAYEYIESVANTLRAQIVTDFGLGPFVTSAGKEHFDRFQIRLMEVQNQSIWISDEVSKKISELNLFLLQEIDNQIDGNKNVDLELTKLGVKHIDRFRLFRKEIEDLIYNDLAELDKIPRFIKRVKDHSFRMPVYDNATPLQKRTDT